MLVVEKTDVVRVGEIEVVVVVGDVPLTHPGRGMNLPPAPAAVVILMPLDHPGETD